MGRISDLILETGRAKAQGQAASGQIWGNTVQQLGSLASMLPGQVREYKAQEAAQQQESQLRALFDSKEPPTAEAIIGIVGPERGMKIAQGMTALQELATKRVTDARDTAGRLAMGVKALSPELQAQFWPTIRQAAVTGGLGSADTIPDQPTPEFLDGVIAWSSGKPHEAPKVGTREVKVRNADGSESIQIVEDKPGQNFTSAAPQAKAPEAGSLEDAILTYAREKKRPVETLSMREKNAIAAQWEAARRAPERTEPALMPVTSVDENTGEIVTTMVPKVAGEVSRKPGKEPTQGQYTAGGYAGRMEQAEGIFSNIEKDIAGMNWLSYKAQGSIPPAAQSDNYKSFDQASRNFINAVLRRESGAAIAPSEFESAKQQYLPQPGDDEKLLAQKKANRDYVFSTLKREAGRAYQAPVQPPPGNADVPSIVTAALKGQKPGKHTLSDGSTWTVAADGTIARAQ
jgi:hypothetical protein